MRPPAAMVAVLLALVATTAGCGAEPERPVEAHAMVAPEPTGPPTGDPDAGEPLFASNCAACHGDQGEGGFGPDLRSSVVAADFDALVEQITQGQGDMPAFSESLSTAEVEDIAAYVHTQIVEKGKRPVAPVTPETGKSPTAVPTDADLDLGQAIFAQNCASCHGPRGEGTDLAPKIPSDLGFADMQTIVSGGALAMPAFSLYLGGDEIAAVSAYAIEELGGQ